MRNPLHCARCGKPFAEAWCEGFVANWREPIGLSEYARVQDQLAGFKNIAVIASDSRNSVRALPLPTKSALEIGMFSFAIAATNSSVDSKIFTILTKTAVPLTMCCLPHKLDRSEEVFNNRSPENIATCEAAYRAVAIILADRVGEKDILRLGKLLGEIMASPPNASHLSPLHVGDAPALAAALLASYVARRVSLGTSGLRTFYPLKWMKQANFSVADWIRFFFRGYEAELDFAKSFIDLYSTRFSGGLLDKTYQSIHQRLSISAECPAGVSVLALRPPANGPASQIGRFAVLNVCQSQVREARLDTSPLAVRSDLSKL